MARDRVAGPARAGAVDRQIQVDDLIETRTETDYRMWAEYWFARYLSAGWQVACVGWTIHCMPRRQMADAAPMSKGFAAAVDRLRAKARPDAEWMFPVIERFRAKVRAKIAAGWRVEDRGRVREPSIQECARQLAETHADQAAEAGIIPDRASIRAQHRRELWGRAEPRRAAPISEAERERAAMATAEAMA